MTRELTWANDAQRRFFMEGPGGVLGYYGGFGSGKSTVLCLKLLWIADMFPGSQIALVRRTASQLRKTTLSTLLAWLPHRHIRRYNEQAGIVELKNGSKLFLLHLDTPDSLGVLKSLELTAAGVDQAEEVDSEAIDLLDRRVGRWREAKIPAYLNTPDWPWRDNTGVAIAPKWMLLTFNCPGFDSYLWHRFAPDSPDRAVWEKRGYRHIVASSRDNRFLGQANLDTLLAGGKDFVDRYVDAVTWGITEGLVFDVPDMAILEPEPGLIDRIKRGMKLHRSLDHGETAPACCLWHGTDSENRIFVYREYYEPDRLVSDHRKAISLLSADDHSHYYSNLADPSIFFKARGRTVNVGPRWSIADEYSSIDIAPKDTALYWTSAENDESVTRTRLKEYLRIDPTCRHPVTGQKGAPRLYFVKRTPNYPNGCYNVIHEMRSQRFKMIGETSDGKKMFNEERDEKVPDHAVDALRYFVVSRPALGSQPQRPDANPGDIYIDQYYAMEEAVKLRRRRRERMQGVAPAGYGG